MEKKIWELIVSLTKQTKEMNKKISELDENLDVLEDKCLSLQMINSGLAKQRDLAMAENKRLKEIISNSGNYKIVGDLKFSDVIKEWEI